MIVVLSDAAEADLERIGDWIAEQNIERAISFVAELRALCEDLGGLPRAFPVVPRYEGAGVRRRAYKDYLIFYRIGPSSVDVLHIRTGRRIMKLFCSEIRR